MPRFVHVAICLTHVLTLSFAFNEASMEEGPSVATKEVKTAMFYGWKYRYYFVNVRRRTCERNAHYAQQARSHCQVLVIPLIISKSTLTLCTR